MSIIDNALRANRIYAKRHDPKLAQRPAPKIAVVTCMDPRLSHLPEILGLPHADIDVIRTGGPAVTKMFSASWLFPPAYSEQRRSCSSTIPAADSPHSPTMS